MKDRNVGWRITVIKFVKVSRLLLRATGNPYVPCRC